MSNVHHRNFSANNKRQYWSSQSILQHCGSPLLLHRAGCLTRGVLQHDLEGCLWICSDSSSNSLCPGAGAQDGVPQVALPQGRSRGHATGAPEAPRHVRREWRDATDDGRTKGGLLFRPVGLLLLFACQASLRLSSPPLLPAGDRFQRHSVLSQRLLDRCRTLRRYRSSVRAQTKVWRFFFETFFHNQNETGPLFSLEWSTLQ